MQKREGKSQKEEKFIPEEILPTLSLAINLMPDTKIIEELFCLAERYRGKHPLQLTIKSKSQDIIIESKMKVNTTLLDEAKKLGIYQEEKLVVES